MRELQFTHMDTGWRQRTSAGCSHLSGWWEPGTQIRPAWTHRPGSENCGQSLGHAQRGPRLLSGRHLKAEGLDPRDRPGGRLRSRWVQLGHLKCPSLFCWRPLR